MGGWGKSFFALQVEVPGGLERQVGIHDSCSAPFELLCLAQGELAKLVVSKKNGIARAGTTSNTCQKCYEMTAMRYLPQFQHDCHICHTTFQVQNLKEGRNPGPSRQVPSQCPACEAPIRGRIAVEIGRAKQLLFALMGEESFVREYGDLLYHLHTYVIVEEELDKYLNLIRDMDYEKWISYYRQPYSYRGAAKERALVKKMAACADELERRFQIISELFRRELRMEREHYLAKKRTLDRSESGWEHQR
jgi:hypothetical protein